MNTRKKTAFGILGVAATAALAVGATAPAMADDSESTSTVWNTTKTTELLGGTYEGGDTTGGDITGGDVSNESPVVVAPQVDTGDILSGGVLNGNAVGNDVGSGNVLGSGNDTAIGSGNDTAIDGVDVDASDVFDSTVGDITGDVSDLLDDIDVSLDGMFED
jgi:opacity protein-like surface antigen